MSGVQHLLSDARGIHIPRHFVDFFNIASVLGSPLGNSWEGIEYDDVVICQNPDHPEYWEAWQCILDCAYWIDQDGYKWSLHQDGDLWAICYEKLTEEEKKNFGFND